MVLKNGTKLWWFQNFFVRLQWLDVKIFLIEKFPSQILPVRSHLCPRPPTPEILKFLEIHLSEKTDFFTKFWIFEKQRLSAPQQMYFLIK